MTAGTGSAGVAELRRAPKPWRLLWITASWGACFVAIRWGLRDSSLLWFAALRALVAGVCLVLVAEVQSRPRPRGFHAWLLITVLGLVNVAVAFAAMFAGVSGLATGTAAVLANAQPLLILLPAWWLYGEAVTVQTAAALAVGFSGLLVVAVPGGGGSGALLSLLAAAAITGGTLLSRRLAGLDVLAASGWHFVIGGVALAVWAGMVEGPPAIDWTPRFVAVLAFLSLVGTAAAFVAWFTETRHCRLDALSAWTFLAPVVGIILGSLLFGEWPTGWSAAGLLAVLASMWIVLRPRPERSGT
ncbi:MULTISPECIES: DMT family transporter [unclassified Rhodococcus (in: high G+C Gram-positive bacteria)]|uniref:DMT family transporter n=1 Tax=unclassified Rhodococcus (in: high G+C Gram-positive bacteria) TaxID=192944 RepID=UPI0006887414|nr:DMT family transporter [Rhodococcus sp. DK17]